MSNFLAYSLTLSVRRSASTSRRPLVVGRWSTPRRAPHVGAAREQLDQPTLDMSSARCPVREPNSPAPPDAALRDRGATMTAPPGDLADLTATALVEGYARAEISPVEATRAVLDRIAARDGELNAF